MKALHEMPLNPGEEALLGKVGVPTQGTLRIAGPSWESARAAQEALQVCSNYTALITAA